MPILRNSSQLIFLLLITPSPGVQLPFLHCWPRLCSVTQQQQQLNSYQSRNQHGEPACAAEVTLRETVWWEGGLLSWLNFSYSILFSTGIFQLHPPLSWLGAASSNYLCCFYWVLALTKLSHWSTCLGARNRIQSRNYWLKSVICMVPHKNFMSLSRPR